MHYAHRWTNLGSLGTSTGPIGGTCWDYWQKGCCYIGHNAILLVHSKLGGKGRAWLFLYAAAAARFASASGTSQLLVPAGRQWAHIAGQRTQNQKDGPVFCLSVCCWKHACLSYFLQFIIEIGVVVIEAVKSVNEADWQGFDIFFIFSCDIVQV